MGKLTDRQHKKMIARYAECQNYRQVAREFKVSESTVRAHCKKDPDTAQKAAQKKEQNTQEMLAYMDAQKGEAQRVLSLILEAMKTPEKLAKANVRDLATAYGIIADKFLKAVPATEQDENDDGFLEALSGTAADDWAEQDDESE